MANLTIDFDSLKQEHWSSKELRNAELISDFVQHLMNDHDFDYVLETYGNANYVQHNRNIPDGIVALIGFVQEFAKRFPEAMPIIKIPQITPTETKSVPRTI